MQVDIAGLCYSVRVPVLSKSLIAGSPVLALAKLVSTGHASAASPLVQTQAKSAVALNFAMAPPSLVEHATMETIATAECAAALDAVRAAMMLLASDVAPTRHAPLNPQSTAVGALVVEAALIISVKTPHHLPALVKPKVFDNPLT